MRASSALLRVCRNPFIPQPPRPHAPAFPPCRRAVRGVACSSRASHQRVRRRQLEQQGHRNLQPGRRRSRSVGLQDRAVQQWRQHAHRVVCALGQAGARRRPCDGPQHTGQRARQPRQPDCGVLLQWRRCADAHAFRRGCRPHRPGWLSTAVRLLGYSQRRHQGPHAAPPRHGEGGRHGQHSCLQSIPSVGCLQYRRLLRPWPVQRAGHRHATTRRCDVRRAGNAPCGCAGRRGHFAAGRPERRDRSRRDRRL